MAEDLQRIEQYVEMVLVFLPLDVDSADYVVGNYELDDVIKSVVRKFSTQFICRKIGLLYEPLNVRTGYYR